MHPDDTRPYPLALIVYRSDNRDGLVEYEVWPMLRSQVPAPEGSGPFASEAEAEAFARRRYPDARIIHGVYARNSYSREVLERDAGTLTPARNARSLWYRQHGQ